MERLTFTDEEMERIDTDCPVKNDYHIDRFCDNVCDEFQNNCPFMKMAQKLKAYEDKLEQGLLIELHCKVGDTVYRIYDDCDFPGDCHTKRMCKGCKYRNLFIEEQAFCLSMLHQDGILGHPYYKSRSEAEEALAKMGGANNG